MITTANNPAKEKINWQFPDKDQVVMAEDFCEMVREAEKGKPMSLLEFKNKMDVWFKER